MTRFFFLLKGVLVLSLLLAGWPAQAGDKALLGAGMGAALGGFLGSQIGKGDGQLAATGAGVFLGGMMGEGAQRSLERSDTAYALHGGQMYALPYDPPYRAYAPTYVAPYDYPVATRAEARDFVYVRPGALEYYSPRQTVWVEGGHVGVAPPRPRHRGGRHCREFTQTTRIDGHTHESYGTACLRPDGSWQIEP